MIIDLSVSLGTRIKTVVGEAQSAYVQGQSILDGPLIVNELCGWAKSIKKNIMLFKVDFNKAFDSINWEYLDSILSQMGFGVKWWSWIRSCLASTRTSVAIKGLLTKQFSISKGVRQGESTFPLPIYKYGNGGIKCCNEDDYR